MHFNLRCDRCGCHFRCDENSRVGEALERFSAAGPWLVLGDGETMEDRLHADLTSQGNLCCPRCGTPVTWHEERLGRLTQQLLGQW